MMWRASDRLGCISYRATNAMEVGPCAATLAQLASLQSTLSDRALSLFGFASKTRPVRTVPAVFHASTPGLRCTDGFANGLLENFRLLFK